MVASREEWGKETGNLGSTCSCIFKTDNQQGPTVGPSV